jgi:hypothetical protein
MLVKFLEFFIFQEFMMSLDRFGTECVQEERLRRLNIDRGVNTVLNPPGTLTSPDIPVSMDIAHWSRCGSDKFFFSGPVVDQLPAGFYSTMVHPQYGIGVSRRTLTTDSLIDFPESRAHVITDLGFSIVVVIYFTVPKGLENHRISI